MSKNNIARHVYHPATSGTDRLHAWQEATHESFFVWGKDAGGVDGRWFGSVKPAFRNWLEKTKSAELTVYHDGMGADALGPLDPAGNKVLLLHTWVPRWQKNFEWMLRCTGKVLVGELPKVKVIRDRFAWIPEKYIRSITTPGLREPPPAEGNGPKERTGIWLHGQKWKRFGNRLRSVVDHWPEGAGELEIVCNGNGPRWSQKPHVRWSADLPFQFATMRLHTWDSCLLLNDYALDQPWLIRALQLGCFPIVPEGSSLPANAMWCQESAPRPYQWGEMDSAVNLLRQWRDKGQEVASEFDSWATSVVERHDPDAFPGQWEEAKAQLLRSRPPRLRSRKPVKSAVPVAWYERVQRLRAGL